MSHSKWSCARPFHPVQNDKCPGWFSRLITWRGHNWSVIMGQNIQTCSRWSTSTFCTACTEELKQGGHAALISHLFMWDSESTETQQMDHLQHDRGVVVSFLLLFSAYSDATQQPGYKESHSSVTLLVFYWCSARAQDKFASSKDPRSNSAFTPSPIFCLGFNKP